MMQFFVPFIVRQSSGSFNLTVLLVSRGCMCYAAHPRGSKGWSMLCDCCFS